MDTSEGGIEAVRRCWTFLDVRGRRLWTALLPLSLLAACLEAVGALLIFGWVRTITEPDALWHPWLSEAHMRLGAPPHREFLLFFGGFVAVFYLFKNALLVFEVYAANRLASYSGVVLATDILRRYLLAPYPFHLERSSGDLIRNVNGSAEVAFRNVLVPASHILVEACLVTGIIVVLMFTAPIVTLLVAAVMGVILGLVLMITNRRFDRWGHDAHDLNGRILAKLQQSFDVVKEIKVLGREQFFYEAYRELRRALSDVVWKRATLQAVPRHLIEAIFVLGVVALIASFEGANEVNLVPLLGLFAYAGFRVLPSLHRIAGHINMIRFGAPAVFELYRDRAELAVETAADDALPFENELRLEAVSFRYGERDALCDVDLVVHRGEALGIIGPTGSGKSTLLDVILGLLEPTKGTVTVDGTALEGQERRWWRRFGYVPQDSYLVDDTLANNITLGLVREARDLDRLNRAVETAQLESLIERLPEGLETVVGERGVRLSGGEKQRIAIARALYHEPDILVFDEATSALDPETERSLDTAIQKLRGVKTMLIVAHRQSTVASCDRIVQVDSGRVRAT